MRALVIIAVVPVVLALAACGSPAQAPTGSPAAPPAASQSATATPTPTPAPTTATPQVVNPTDYLLDGAIGGDGDVWQAKFGFFTDASKAVRCDISVNSETPGRVTCQVMVGSEGEVSYAVPGPVSDQCDASSATYRDGYEVGLGLFQSIGTDSGFYACRELQAEHADWVASTKVIPDAGTINVQEFSCTVAAGVASCGRPGKSGGFVFGLSVASFTS